MRIEHGIPVLPATDVAANREFWTDVVGFTANGGDPGFVAMALDGFPLFLSHVDSQDVPDNTMLWLKVDDVSGWRDHLVGRGVSTVYTDISGPAVTGLSEQIWGLDFALRDPAGNCVHFFTPQKSDA